MAFTEIVVTNTYTLQGNVPASGYVRFVLSAPMTNGETVPRSVQVATISATGTISITLYANDDVGTTPTGTVYEVTEMLTGKPSRVYSVSVPHAATGGTVILSTLVPTLGANNYPYLLAPGGADNNDVLYYNASANQWQAGPVPAGEGALEATANLSDVANAATALANLGGASAATVKPILFNLADVNGTQQLFRSNTDGTGATQITSSTTYHSWRPKWSPSGRQILFNRTPSSDSNYEGTLSHTSLWVANADGTNPVEIVTPQQIGGAGSVLVTPNWLPNGRIIFGVNGLLYGCNSDGAFVSAITTGVTDLTDACPSPDGTRAVFSRTSTGDLWMLDFASGASSQLTSDGGGSGTPPHHNDATWTPDGQYVLFETWTNASANSGVGAWQIESMRPDGSGRTIISETTSVITNPTADLDNWVYCYYLNVGVANWQICKIRLDGSMSAVAPITLTDGTREAGQVDVFRGHQVQASELRRGKVLPSAVAVSNSTSEVSVISRTIGANYLRQADEYKFRLSGFATTNGATPGTLTLRIRFGTASLSGSVLASVVIPLTAYCAAQQGLRIDGDFIVHATGVSGTANVGGQLGIRSQALIAGYDSLDSGASSVTTGVDTTVNNVLELTAQFSSASTSNAITFTHPVIEAVLA